MDQEDPTTAVSDEDLEYDFGSLGDGDLEFVANAHQRCRSEGDQDVDMPDDDTGAIFAGLPDVMTDMDESHDQGLTSPLKSALDHDSMEICNNCNNDLEDDEICTSKLDDQRVDSHSPELPNEAPTRQLRTPAAQQYIPSTWMDNDDSGNFDPIEDARRDRRRRVRVRRRPSAVATRVKDAAQRLQITLIARLQFRSEESRGSFARLVVTSISEQIQTGYNLRSRNSTTEEETDEVVDLTGHPEARGCMGCFELGIPCPLLEDEYAWPCHNCDEIGEFCMLLTPPAQKRACEDCKRLKKPCSFIYTRNHFDKCQDCTIARRRCNAGPIFEFIQRRVRYPAPGQEPVLPSKKPGKTSIPEDCRECRDAKRSCNYMGTIPARACEACVKRYLPCTRSNAPSETPDPPSEPQSKLAAPSEPKVPAVAAKAKTPSLQPRSIVKDRPASAVKTIKTKFFHPVIFNCDEVAKTESMKCMFCEHQSLAFIGHTLEVRQIAVYDASDSSPLREVREMSDGLQGTTLCLRCTMQRMTVVLHHDHDMSPIEGKVPSDDADQLKALHAIVEKKVRNPLDYCTMCCNLADFKCLAHEIRLSRDNIVPCLRLCQRCYIRWSGIFDKDIKRMLSKLDLNKPFGPGSTRADAELLREDGPLARYLKWSSLNPKG